MVLEAITAGKVCQATVALNLICESERLNHHHLPCTALELLTRDIVASLCLAERTYVQNGATHTLFVAPSHVVFIVRGRDVCWMDGCHALGIRFHSVVRA